MFISVPTGGMAAGQMRSPGLSFFGRHGPPGIVHSPSANLAQPRRYSGNYPKRPLSEAVEIEYEYEHDLHNQPRNIAEAAVERFPHDDNSQAHREHLETERVVDFHPEAVSRSLLHDSSITTTGSVATAVLPQRRPIAPVTIILAEDSTFTEESHGRSGSPSDISDGCIICPQVLPVCLCPQPSHCQLVVQTCHECAHYICRSPEPTRREPISPVPLMSPVVLSHHTSPTTSTLNAQPTTACIQCPPLRLTCNCGSGEICMHRHRTCRRCARIECVLPIGSDNVRR